MTLEQYLFRQHDWSERTFGPGMRTVGVTEHIKKEIEEIRKAPTDKNFARQWPTPGPETEPVEHLK